MSIGRMEGLYAELRAAMPLEVAAPGRELRYAQALGRLLCETLACDHASLWRLVGLPGHYRLQGVGGHEPGRESSVQLEACDQSRWPGYFASLLEAGVFACSDRWTDARLGHFAEDATRPDCRWRAMLDVAVQVNGRIVGVVSVAQREGIRQWSPAEELALRRVAVRAGLDLYPELELADTISV